MKKLILATVSIFTFGIFANADVVANQQLYAAMNVVKAFAFDSNRSIPAEKIKRAKAVAILTDVTRSGFGISLQYGDGVFSMKDEYGEWSCPLMLRYRGVGVGPQAGYSSSDIVVLFYTSESFRGIFNGQDTIELNAGAAVKEGGTTGAASDLPRLSAWSVNPGKVSGIYLGASFDLGKLTINDQMTNDLYGRIYAYEDILNNSPKDTKYLRGFKDTLTKFLGDAQYYRDSPEKPQEYIVTPRDKELR